MDVFDLRGRVVETYAHYVRSFITVRDPDIRAYVESGGRPRQHAAAAPPSGRGNPRR